MAKPHRILRMPEIQNRIPLSRSSIYRKYGHLFVKLGPEPTAASGIPDTDIDAIVDEAVKARDAAAAE